MLCLPLFLLLELLPAWHRSFNSQRSVCSLPKWVARALILEKQFWIPSALRGTLERRAMGAASHCCACSSLPLHQARAGCHRYCPGQAWKNNLRHMTTFLEKGKCLRSLTASRERLGEVFWVVTSQGGTYIQQKILLLGANLASSHYFKLSIVALRVMIQPKCFHKFNSLK